MATDKLADRLSAEIADVIARVLPELADPVVLQDADTGLTLESMTQGATAEGCSPCHYCPSFACPVNCQGCEYFSPPT
ncbi:MAG: hypothetical protein COZ06_08990 [Armatimonadetes bacterium CG_4_10_14_3_um_filter_66_18]|nr:hypothetical protein [Armatimonadota bacterium]OIP06434.1 MAG: hypothetical protein AUJ96_09010 [Armatimonadetes bacterium CG2_30_66_41]PIU90262.1 MAG: hypothetical protein COS65_25715 [Armatimonadetes bacterium CG06_land_8_20_14_3_00_66_21]PIY50512.1 MAG: hypothetical protein COZ06_08990 [Armatimonadetes bacterium CG_4_10_14_3_um_filter_66_18]PIZ46880.1 MAG: hypothetical protein COY42_09730 [Armatimonadetes bacterium CG_4_10_14_0_8_um_filter_66_14]